MSILFPYYRQRDAMDCGPTCIKMIAASHGKSYPLSYLRELSYLSREGVSALGIMEAAEAIGFRSITVKVPYDTGKDTACLYNAPLPCIAHWNQQHFVVVHKVKKDYVWVADPGMGKFKLSRKEFEKSWLSDADEGILILLETTPKFYRHNPIAEQEALRIDKLTDYVRPFRKLTFQLLIGMTLSSVFLTIFPFLTQSIVDYGIDNKDLGFISMILIAQLILFSGQISVQFLQNRILMFIGSRINIAMISDFLAKMMRLPIGFFDTKMTGDLLQRIGDQTRIEQFLTHSALPVLFSALNFFVFSVILSLYNSFIFLIFILSALSYIIWVVYFLRKRKELDYIRFQQSGENNNALIEIIQGMQEIKIQGSERKRRWIWAGIQAKLFHTNYRSLQLAQWQDAGGGFINQSKNILIAFLAAKTVIDGQMTLGMMLATQYMVGQLDAPLQQFIAFIRSAQDAKISVDRLNEVQNMADEEAQTPSTISGMVCEPIQETEQTMQDIHLNQVSFRYNALHEDVLNDINLCIPSGKVTAIVGMSGSGKTTLLKLLLGFYPPTKGEIRIGHTPLNQISPAQWRKRCGTVLQDGFIFSDTIANNIAESDEKPNISKLRYAAKIANISDFIQDLPLGYNTKIGATGNGVSQGQRQRLLIARAVYKNPDLLLFDEATNALDANNEKIIVENLQQFYQSSSLKSITSRHSTKTVVVVAHRLSTVRHADQIIVLKKGKVVETGSHDQLVALKGEYYHLIKNQLELGA